MSSYGYQIAHQQAVSEIAEINAQLEMLSHRKEMLEKLLGLLQQLAPESNLADAPVSVPDAQDPKAEVTQAAAQEDPADDLAARRVTAQEAPAFRVSEPEVAANEPSPSAAEEFRELHAYAESGTQPAMKATTASGRPNRHEEVAQLAHSFWTERGHTHGHHEDDWFRAEQELYAAAA